MSPRVSVTRIEHFSAAHRLFNPKLSKEENERIFGKCAGENGHGHNFQVEVTVYGEVDPTTGMVINLNNLKGIINTHVIEPLDHKNVDKDVDHFRDNGVVSTSENIVVFIWNCLRPHIDSKLELEVKLHETCKNTFIYRGD
ncbi:unnamed protein product [Hymenolepis diminuta]|uniref:6-pyruvoyltetrahydropterin synthase n=1 Tax=Hymenolepis diminuta TaxID=6216 RepID=A0A0R3SIT1_HYMDI|nr:unnamed protein product [Hymenolepis diminuta]